MTKSQVSLCILGKMNAPDPRIDLTEEALALGENAMSTGHAVGERPIVFVSCGQYTDEERALGDAIAKIISLETAAEGYFAQNQTSLEGVSDHVLSAIGRCVGFVGVLHHRGDVSALNTPSFIRASVWIEQEIAIAAYIVHKSRTAIPVQLYIQDGIRLEGLRDKLLLNAVHFTSNADVLDHFRRHAKSVFASALVTVRGEEPNLESPLGQKPFPRVSLTLGAVNPDFVVGAAVRPFSYLSKRRVLDQEDEDFIERLGHLSRGKAANLHLPFTKERIRDGVILTTPDPNQTRQGGPRMQPEQRIQIDSDGDITIRFIQNDSPPLFQFLSVIGVAYVIANQLYPRFGLEPRARVDAVLHLHAGRTKHTPILPTSFREGTIIDLGRDDFVTAFSDPMLQLCRASDWSSNRQAVNEVLQRFADENLP